MKIIEPLYQLVRAQFSEHEWIFHESPEASVATEKFDVILDRGRCGENLGRLLRPFLKDHPWHFDAMTHYASCKRAERKFLEAYAFATTALATAREAFPPEFDEANHQIPGGFVANRPFLRALYEKMESCVEIGELSAAIATGFSVLKYDVEDRMGAHEVLPKYLLMQGRYQRAIDLFDSEPFKGTFHRAEYLRPVALLRLGRHDEAIAAIEDCLGTPATARYLLDPMLPQPKSDSPIGGFTSGSDLEGYFYGWQYRDLWIECPGAINLLSSAAKKVAAAGWPRYYAVAKHPRH